DVREWDVLEFPVHAEHRDPAVQQRRRAHVAALLHRETVEQLMPRQRAHDAPARTDRERLEHAGRLHIERPELLRVGVVAVDDALVRRQPDAVERDRRMNRAGKMRAVWPRVVERAVVTLVPEALAEVGEPESALAIEDEIVRAAQPRAFEAVVDAL